MQKVKKLKIAICCVLIAIMVLSASVCTGLFTAKNTTGAVSGNWSENSYYKIRPDGSYISELKLVNGYYQISVPQELSFFNQNLATYVSAKIILTNNIDLSAHYWTPNTNVKFKGVFDGNYYTITGLTIDGGSSAGLFGTIDYGATIKNLNIKSASITKATGDAGIICGYLEGLRDNDYSIKNCNISDSSITYIGSGRVRVGGIAGFSYSSLITNCMISNLSITHSGGSDAKPSDCYVGGVIGRGANCRVYITGVEGSSTALTATATSSCYAGGIVGEMYQDNNSTTTTAIEKCYYAGTSISAGYYVNTNNGTVNAYAGGIVGALNYGDVFHCFNTAKISSTAKEQKGEEQKFDTNIVVDGKSQNEQACDLYELFVVDNVYICKGTRTDSGAYGDYKEKPYQSYYHSVTKNAYSGGIVGYAGGKRSIAGVYNIGEITTTGISYNHYQLYFKYFKKGLFGGHHYDYKAGSLTAKGPRSYFKGNIIGYHEESTILYKYANAAIDPKLAPSASSFENSFMYVGGEGSPYTNVSQSKKFSGNILQVFCYAQDGRYDEKEVIVYQRELTNTRPYRINETLTTENVADIATSCSSVWAIKEGVNNGNPIIKAFYWEFEAFAPGANPSSGGSSTGNSGGGGGSSGGGGFGGGTPSRPSVPVIKQ